MSDTEWFPEVKCLQEFLFSCVVKAKEQWLWAGWEAKTGSCITAAAHFACLHLICRKRLNLQETKALSYIKSLIFSTSAILLGNLLNKLHATNHSIGDETDICVSLLVWQQSAIYACSTENQGKLIQLDTLTYRLINSSTIKLFWLASMSNFKVYWPTHIRYKSDKPDPSPSQLWLSSLVTN